MNEFSENQITLTELTDQLWLLQQDNLDRHSLIQKKLNFLSAETERHKNLLAEIRYKKALEMRSIEALKQDAVQLNEMIEKLALDSTQEMNSDSHQLNEPKSNDRFVSRKGKLHPPVSGKPVSRSDARVESGLKAAVDRGGIHFQTDRGEPVHAIHSGRVVFSEWVKGYGNMIIIDHGEHYFSVYAHLADFFRIKNDAVQDGEVIATTGSTDSITGSGVYFEIRNRSEPVNLEQWLQINVK